MSLLDGRNDRGSRGNRLLENSSGVLNRQDHAGGAAVQRFRAEVRVLGRFVRHPELGITDRQLRNDGPAGIVHPEEFLRAKGKPVKRNGPRSVTNGEHRGD